MRSGTAQLWALDGETPFDTSGVTNLTFTWWAGEGSSPDAITEWEELINPLGTRSPVFVPTQDEVDMYLMVRVGYTDTDGAFRTAASPVTTSPVEDVSAPGTLQLVYPDPLRPGTAIPAGTPVDPDGLMEDDVFTYQWSWTETDPATTESPVWTDYVLAERPDATSNSFAVSTADVGRWVRVSIGYTDGAGNSEMVSAHTGIPVTAEAPPIEDPVVEDPPAEE